MTPRASRANAAHGVDPFDGGFPSNGLVVVELTDGQLERLAELVAARLRSGDAADGRLVSAAEKANQLGCDAKTVYRHADELGAVRVGRRVMFPADSRYASVGSPAVEAPAVPGASAAIRRTERTSDCQLLPVGRRKTGSEAES
jgi:hypothetical protein